MICWLAWCVEFGEVGAVWAATKARRPAEDPSPGTMTPALYGTQMRNRHGSTQRTRRFSGLGATGTHHRGGVHKTSGSPRSSISRAVTLPSRCVGTRHWRGISMVCSATVSGLTGHCQLRVSCRKGPSGACGSCIPAGGIRCVRFCTMSIQSPLAACSNARSCVQYPCLMPAMQVFQGDDPGGLGAETG